MKAASKLDACCLYVDYIRRSAIGIDFIICQDGIHTYIFAKQGKWNKYDLFLWYASIRNFPFRINSKICTSYGGNFTIAILHRASM